MKYLELGKTEITVSAIAMGCWALAGDDAWGFQDDKDSIDTVHAAVDVGVNFFDTAEGYGNGRSERVLGQALAGRRDSVVIATKASPSHLSGPEIEQACERSLRLLQTDYIDLYQIHWPSRSVPIAESLQALEKLQRQGKIRAIGVCNFGPTDFAELLTVGGCESNQLPYSLLWRGIEYEIGPACTNYDVGILCYSPLAQGLLTGKFASADDVPPGRARTRHFSSTRLQTRHGEEGYEAETFATIDKVRHICQKIDVPMTQVALAWLLHQRGVTSVLVGARRPEQIKQNAQASDLELPSDVVSNLTKATDVLKQRLGTNLDQYQSESRFR